MRKPKRVLTFSAMSFRRAFVFISIAGATLAALVAFSLYAITSREQKLIATLENSSEGAHAAKQLEINLLVHQRASALSLFTPSQEHERVRKQAEAELSRWFAAAGRYVGSDYESTLLMQAMRDVEHYRLAWRNVPSNGGRSLESSIANRELRQAADSVAALAEENRSQAATARRELSLWNQRSSNIGLAVGATLLLCTLGGIVLARTSLYQAFVSIRDALLGFEVGRAKLLVERGPEELRVLARNFNAMTRSLAERRRTQFGFLAAVAHDMRTPLSAMNMAAERLVALDDPKLKGTAQIIARQINTLTRLADDLLDTTRIEAGQLHLQPEPADLVPILRQSVALFHQTSQRHDLRLALPESLWLRIDPVRIRQVVNNLLSNAIKYSPEGGRIDVEADVEPNRVVIRVSDFGVGIPLDEQARVFEPFRRSSSASHVAPGVGLGLAVARDIAEAHHGTLVLERSLPGAGATFRLELPAPC